MHGLKGLLKCTIHNESFDTPTEWYKHESEKPHGHTGSTKCEDCGCENCPCDPQEINKVAKGKARCTECAEMQEKAVLERIARKKEKKDG